MDLPKLPEFAGEIKAVAEKAAAKGPEHYVLIAKQLVSAATILGILSLNDANDISIAISKIIGAVFVLITNAGIVAHFVHKSFASRAAGFIFSALALGFVGSPVQAQWANPPLMPYRANVEKRLKALEVEILALRQLTPHVLPQPAPPLQAFPIPGQPKQDFQIQGAPKRDMPIQGQPKQDFKIDGAPKQHLPQGGPPKQDFPIQGPIGQPLPLAPPGTVPPPPAPGPGQPQRITRVYAIWPCRCPDCPCGPDCGSCKKCK